MKPHRSQYWLNANPQDLQEFSQQVAGVCELYAQAQELHSSGVHVVSTDEKTGIQALVAQARNNPRLRQTKIISRSREICIKRRRGLFTPPCTRESSSDFADATGAGGASGV